MLSKSPGLELYTMEVGMLSNKTHADMQVHTARHFTHRHTRPSILVDVDPYGSST
jgi:hypothetical protein